jgi:Metal binding domain of Ada
MSNRLSNRFLSNNSTHNLPRSEIIAFLFLLLSAGNVVAQDSQCKVKLSELPQAAELSGFQMGMTVDQVKARVPQVVFGPTDDLGTLKTSVNPHFDSRINKSGFADVRTVSLDFLDGRITSLWIGYDSSFKWPTVVDFVKGISQSLSLPNAWSPWKLQGQQLKCADFQVTVSSVAGGPSFRILDLTADATLAARRVAKEEEKEALAENSEEEEAEIVGDKQTKVYYPADCEAAKEINALNRTTFKTASDAEKAGYKPAKECEP